MALSETRFEQLNSFVCAATGAKKIIHSESLQTLWSGYGNIIRFVLSESQYDSVIVKWIKLSPSTTHPRGWNTDTGHARKVKSYEVESNWYQHWSCEADNCRIPIFIAARSELNERVIVLEDLDSSGYSSRAEKLSDHGLQTCIHWLAAFHSRFLGKGAVNLWPVGTYWHLATREDEFRRMPNGKLKASAMKLDSALNSAKYQTIVHGDAKIANFCFDGSYDRVAALDFQYVGGGVGVKDLAYFLGSCLDNDELFEKEEWALNVYFETLRSLVSDQVSPIDIDNLENEWRSLYSVAVADFVRFLSGWQPGHRKLNPYVQSHVERALSFL